MIPQSPLPLVRGGSNGTTIMLTPEQEKWLRLYYPTELTTELAAMMGIHKVSLVRMARHRGLAKALTYYQHKNELLSQQAKEKIAAERRREHFGLPRHTHYHLPLRPFTQKEITRRNRALERGYILSPDLSESGGKRYCIYYDDSTSRRLRFEANCKQVGFQIKRWPTD